MQPTRDLIVAASGRCTEVPCDIGDPEQCDRLIGQAVRVYGHLDLLVNNARLAGVHSKPLLATTNEDFDAMTAVNVRGPFQLCRASVGQMLAQRPDDGVRGRIVNIGSVYGDVGAPKHFIYAVGKAALHQMTRQIALEYGRDGALCIRVVPGKIESGSTDIRSEDPQVTSHVRARTPFGRWGERADIAAAVSFLAARAGFVSGSRVIVDGGFLAS